MRKSILKLLALLTVLCFVALPAWSKGDGDDQGSEQGTTAEDLAQLKLPQPAQVKVLVVPFWDYTSNIEHQHMATAASWMLFERQGFKMLPVLLGADVVAKDKDLEPGLPLRKEDAVRLGKTAGANWVVYGEVKELRVYKKEAFFKRSKNLYASMRIAIADVASGQLLYYKVRGDKIGGTGLQKGFQSSGEKLKRVGVMSVSDKSLTPLFAALPQHSVSGKVPDSGDLAGFIDRTWPTKK